MQTTVSEASGDFRFVGLQPDTYGLKAELAGFLTQQVDAVVVGLAKTVTVDLSLKLGGVTENVDVRAAASTVDVRGASTDTNLSNDLLTLMPIYSATSTGLLNYAPGINNSSAYGSQGSYGNALLLDGVDTRDPEGGSAWTFFNQNLIQEVQIGGLGAPAEFGGFTGAIINTVTKSGGNAYSGLFTMRYTRDSFAGDNINSSVLSANPTLGQAAVTKKLTDYTVQLGGPLKQDKAFFFASVQRYSTKTDPTGPVANSTDISPRFNVKLTFQPSPTDTVIAGVQYDLYNVTGRVSASWPASQATDRQTVEEDAPEWVWNFQWRKIFGASAFLEAKFTGYDGYYNLDPVDPSPYTFDGLTGEYCCGGGGGLYYNDRSRNQVQVALTKYAEKFGRHSLKFGLEIERSHLRNIGQPYGPIQLLHLHLRRCSVLPIQLQLRRPGRQQPHIRVRAGSMDSRKTDAEPWRAPGSHPGPQSDSEQGCLHTRERVGTSDWGRVRSDRQGPHGREGLLRAILRRRCRWVLRVRGSRHRGLRYNIPYSPTVNWDRLSCIVPGIRVWHQLGHQTSADR